MKRILYLIFLVILFFIFTKIYYVFSYGEKCGIYTCGWCTKCVGTVCKSCSDITEIKCIGCKKVNCRGTCVNGDCLITDCGNAKCDSSCKGPQCNWNLECCQTSDQGCGAYGCPPNTKRICTKCEGDSSWSCSCIQDSSCGYTPPPQPSCNNVILSNPLVQPSPVIEGENFQIWCPANSRYDCISAYSNGDTKICSFVGWSQNTAIFSCPPLTQGYYTARCKTFGGTSNNCCITSKDTSYYVIKTTTQTATTTTKVTTTQIKPLTLSLNVSCEKCPDNTNLTIISKVSSSGNPVKNSNVKIEVISSKSVKKLDTSCITDDNGYCYINYRIQSEKGTWTVIGIASAEGYSNAYDSKNFEVVECTSSNNCKCYEYCTNYECRDFRSYMGGCNYYDACPGQDCCNQNGCNPEYCLNVDEDICEDQNFICHGWFINCGNN